MKSTPGLVGFNSGELSPAMQGRVELKQYATGCYKLENFIPMVQGPARRRPGTRYVAEVKDSSKPVALMEFNFNTFTSFLLEWGDYYVRFYKNRAPLMSGGSPYEIVSPYPASDLFDANGFMQLVYIQSADVVYITHRSSKYPAYKLSHYADTNWTLAPVDFLGGPFGETNPGSNPVVYASAISGKGITLTASSNIWDPLLVGSYFQLTQSDFRSVRPWEASVSGSGPSIKLGALRSYNGVTYKLIARGPKTTTTGTRPPTNLSGAQWDSGDTGKGNLWEYRDAGFGFVKITAVGGTPAGSQVNVTGIAVAAAGTDGIGKVTVTVASLPTGLAEGSIVFITGCEGSDEINDQFYKAVNLSGVTFELVQDDIDGDGTASFVNGSFWDPYTGGGTADNRLWTATADVIVQDAQLGIVNRLPTTVIGYQNATPQWAVGAFNDRDGYPTAVSFFRGRLCFAKAGNVYLSVSQDFENFSALTPGGLVTADMSIMVTLPTQDVIQWMIEGRVLVIGTASAEHVIQEINTAEPLGPANIASKAQMRHGSRGVRPVLIGYSLLWMQTSGRKMRIMKYQFFTDQYQSEDLAALANHVLEASQVLGMTFQQEPDTVVWMNRADGQLIGLTFNEEQEVVAWHRHPMIGSVEGVASIPAPSGLQDDLWVVVNRTINGATKRYIEYLAEHFITGDSLVNKAYYHDSGTTVTLTSPGTAVTGLGYLEGETVKVITDGAKHPDCVVKSGKITLNWAATVIQVGLEQLARLVTMPIEVQTRTGTAQGQIKRIHDLSLRFLNTLGGRVGVEDPDQEISEPAVDTLEILEFREPDDPMNAPVDVYNGIYPPETYDWNFPGGYEVEGRITYRNNTSYPCTLAGLYPALDVTEDG